MNSYTTVTILGRVFRDAESKVLPSGITVANFSIGAGRSYKDKNDNWVKKPMFIEVAAFGKVGEIAAKIVRKDENYLVAGTLEMESWDDKTTGKKRSKHVINATSVVALSDRKSTDAAAESTEATTTESTAGGSTDDDVPF